MIVSKVVVSGLTVDIKFKEAVADVNIPVEKIKKDGLEKSIFILKSYKWFDKKAEEKFSDTVEKVLAGGEAPTKKEPKPKVLKGKAVLASEAAAQEEVK